MPIAIVTCMRFGPLLPLLMFAACGGISEERTVRVSSYLVPCEGVGPQLCYQLEDMERGTMSLLSQKIEGFDYVWGADYVLHIAVLPGPAPSNTLIDGSSVRYELIEVISQTPSSPDFSLDVAPRFLSMLNSERFGLLTAREIACESAEVCEAISTKLDSFERSGTFSLMLSHPDDSDDPLIARGVR